MVTGVSIAVIVVMASSAGSNENHGTAVIIQLTLATTPAYA